jgi:glycosyltransferase involved in cell wall biosynthesis
MTPTDGRIRILYVEGSTTGVVGGSTTGLQHFLKGLDLRRYEPIVVFYEDKALGAELARSGVGVRVLQPRRRGGQGRTSKDKQSAPRRPGLYRRMRRPVRDLVLLGWQTLPAAWRLARLFKTEKPHAVHLINGFRSNQDGVVAAWITGLPCICHVKKFENYGWIDRLLARTVRLGVCMTEAIREHCQQQGIRPQHLTVVYDGIDLRSFRPAAEAPARIRGEWNIPAEAPVVGIVGNIRYWKGQEIVVEAMHEVRRRFPEIRCLIVGGVHPTSQGYARRIRDYIDQHGLHQHVIFTGFRNDVADMIAAMDVVIHASVTPEPFGRVILEGMALGKPVIATNLGGVPEFVLDGTTGKLVPPGDARALAESMSALLGDAALRERLGHQARCEVNRRFSVQCHVDAMLAAYARIGVGK